MSINICIIISKYDSIMFVTCLYKTFYRAIRSQFAFLLNRLFELHFFVSYIEIYEKSNCSIMLKYLASKEFFVGHHCLSNLQELSLLIRARFIQEDSMSSHTAVQRTNSILKLCSLFWQKLDITEWTK